MSKSKAILKLDKNISSMLRMYTNNNPAFEKGRATSIVKQRHRSPKPGTSYNEARTKHVKQSKHLEKEYAK